MTLQDTRAQQGSLDGMTQATAGPSLDHNLQGVNEQVEEVDTVSTSKGLVLRVKPVPNMIIMEARNRMQEPKPPKVFIEDKGVEEENPLDPDYVAALNKFQYEQGLVGFTAMLAFGTEIVTRPTDVLPPDSEEWSEDLHEIFGITVPSRGKARYAAWLRLYALIDPDINKVLAAVRAKSGLVTEEAVKQAAENFPGDTEGPTDNGAPA